MVKRDDLDEPVEGKVSLLTLQNYTCDMVIQLDLPDTEIKNTIVIHDAGTIYGKKFVQEKLETFTLTYVGSSVPNGE